MIDDKYNFDAVEKKYIRELHKSDRPNDELERLLLDIMPKVRKYAEMKKYNTYWYYDTLTDAYEIFDDIYSYLDFPTTTGEVSAAFEQVSKKHTNQHLNCCKETKRLWRIYPKGTLVMGSDKWTDKDMSPGQYHYSPVAYPNINEPVQKYLAAPYLHHPYVTWALINAYLLDTGRRYLSELDDKYRREIILHESSGVSYLFKKFFREPYEFSSGVIYKAIISDEIKFKKLLDGIEKHKKKGIRIDYSIIASAAILGLLTGYIKIGFDIAVIYSIIHFVKRKYMQEEIKRLVNFLDKLKEDTESLNNAWSLANKAIIDIKEIIDKAKKSHSRVPYPEVLGPLFSIVENSKQIDVSAWIQ